MAADEADPSTRNATDKAKEKFKVLLEKSEDERYGVLCDAREYAKTQNTPSLNSEDWLSLRGLVYGYLKRRIENFRLQENTRAAIIIRDKAKLSAAGQEERVKLPGQEDEVGPGRESDAIIHTRRWLVSLLCTTACIGTGAGDKGLAEDTSCRAMLVYHLTPSLESDRFVRHYLLECLFQVRANQACANLLLELCNYAIGKAAKLDLPKFAPPSEQFERAQLERKLDKKSKAQPGAQAEAEPGQPQAQPQAPAQAQPGDAEDDNIEDPEPMVALFAHAYLFTLACDKAKTTPSKDLEDEQTEHLSMLKEALNGPIQSARARLGLEHGRSGLQASTNLLEQESKRKEKLEQESTERDSKKQLLGVLRVLRFIPITSLLEDMLIILERPGPEVDKGTYETLKVFEKIESWGKEILDLNLKGRMETAIGPIIEYCRLSPPILKHGTVATHGLCLKVLGILRAPSAFETLLRELANENVSIVREAVQAIERLVNTDKSHITIKTVTARIVETAQEHSAAIDRFSLAVRFFSKEKKEQIVQELEEIMMSGAQASQAMAQTLLIEAGGETAYKKLKSRTANVEKYERLMDQTEHAMQRIFDKNMSEARWGFRAAMIMDVLVFSVGIALLAISVNILVTQNLSGISSAAGAGATGGVGVLSIIYSIFIAKPREQVQKNTNHMMSLKIVFQAYMRKLQQIDQTFAIALIEGNMTEEKLLAIGTMVKNAMLEAQEAFIKLQNSSAVSLSPQDGGRQAVQSAAMDAVNSAADAALPGSRPLVARLQSAAIATDSAARPTLQRSMSAVNQRLSKTIRQVSPAEAVAAGVPMTHVHA